MSSVLAEVGEKIGDEIKSLDIRMSAAETAIVNLGGQVPPPTGSFSIATVTWTNLTEINLSGGGTVTPSGGVQSYAGGGLYKISGSAGYNAGASTVEHIDGNENGYFQFQIAHLNHAAKIGVVYEDLDYDGDPPYLMNFGGGFIDLYNPFISNQTEYVAGDWFRIRHYALDNELHFQKRQTVYSELPNYVLPSSPNNGHPHHHTFNEEDRPLVVSLETQTVNGVELTKGKAFKIKKYNVSTGSVDLVKLDGTNIGWGSGARASKWEVAEELGEDYVTFYTHPTSTNGSDLYLDTSFHFIGAGINDVQIATAS